MIQTFIEKNRKLLLFYYWPMRIGGWFLLALPSLAVFGHSVALASRITDSQEFHRYWNHEVPWGMFTHLFPAGMLALGVTQLIWYLLATDRRPGWILRNSDKLLYAYAAIMLGCYIWMCVKGLSITRTWDTNVEFIMRTFFAVVFVSVKILALAGLGQILKRLLPLIEESRTLV
jgi:hypothetical protein